jgi:adenine-specific DNA-methyltransferase
MPLSNELQDWIEQVVGPLEKIDLEILEMAKKHFSSSKSIDLPHSIFNILHSKSKQKLLGISYTPIEIREELTSVVLDELSKRKGLRNLRILDPCCGSGTFSVEALLNLKKRGVPLEVAFEENIYFCDIDRLSVALTLLNIACFLKREGIEATKLTPNAKVADYFDIDQKFDGIISNPPYVKLQNLEVPVREKLKKSYPNLFSGSLGLSAIFLAKIFEDLEEGGMAGIITQNNLFTSVAGKSLRGFLAQHVYKIDTFGSGTLFEGVTAYTCLIYLDRLPCKEFSFRKIDPSVGFSSQTSNIQNKSLNSSKWKMGSSADLQNISRLETVGIPLGKACRIWVGIATQMDKAFTVFNVDQTWRGSIGDQSFEIEPEIVRQLIKISELESSEDLVGNNRGVIYPYVIENAKAVAIREKEFKETFPLAYRYLLEWKVALLGRQKGKVKEEDWYKWGRIQSMIPVQGKLLTKTFDRSPTFRLDESDSLFSNGYALVPKSTEFEIKFVQGVLESSTFARYIKATSFEIKGSYHCYQKNFIERFCLPNVSRETQTELVHENQIDDFLMDYFKITPE